VTETDEFTRKNRNSIVQYNKRTRDAAPKPPLASPRRVNAPPWQASIQRAAAAAAGAGPARGWNGKSSLRCSQLRSSHFASPSCE